METVGVLSNVHLLIVIRLVCFILQSRTTSMLWAGPIWPKYSPDGSETKRQSFFRLICKQPLVRLVLTWLDSFFFRSRTQNGCMASCCIAKDHMRMKLLQNQFWNGRWKTTTDCAPPKSCIRSTSVTSMKAPMWNPIPLLQWLHSFQRWQGWRIAMSASTAGWRRASDLDYRNLYHVLSTQPCSEDDYPDHWPRSIASLLFHFYLWLLLWYQIFLGFFFLSSTSQHFLTDLELSLEYYYKSSFIVNESKVLSTMDDPNRVFDTCYDIERTPSEYKTAFLINVVCIALPLVIFYCMCAREILPFVQVGNKSVF